jgi:hypothetical protein
MTQLKVTDEMLMAFVDGELPEAEVARIEVLLESDPGLAERAARLLDSRLVVQKALAHDPGEKVPPELVATILGTKQDLDPARSGRPSWAVAASIGVLAAALGFGANGLLGTNSGSPSVMAVATSDALLARLADEQAGSAIAVNGATAMVTGSYAVDGGYCRLFTVSATTQPQIRALACGGGGAWSVPVAVLEGGEGFQPASASEAIDVYLDNAGAGSALDAGAEVSAIAAGWAL